MSANRLECAGELVVILVVDGVRLRTHRITNPVTALGLSARLRKQGVYSWVASATSYWLEVPEIWINSVVSTSA